MPSGSVAVTLPGSCSRRARTAAVSALFAASMSGTSELAAPRLAVATGSSTTTGTTVIHRFTARFTELGIVSPSCPS